MKINFIKSTTLLNVNEMFINKLYQNRLSFSKWLFNFQAIYFLGQSSLDKSVLAQVSQLTLGAI